jgi:mitogen-activated protein kinase kinase kinase 9
MECSLCDLLHPRAGRSRAVPLRRLLGIAADVAAGLAHLHPTIVHRDLK